MTAGFGSLWVKRDNGAVDRIDPKTGKVVEEISAGPFEPPVCQGIGITEDAVWACAKSDTLIRIDPDTNSIVATVEVKDKLPEQGRLVSAAGRLWVITDAGERLTPVDLESNEPSQPVKLDSKCIDLSVAGSTLFATCPFDDRVLKIDAKTGKVVGDVELAGARNSSVGADLWVGYDGGVAQVDTKALEVKAVYEGDPSVGGAIFATPNAVWFRSPGDPILTLVDPRADRIVETIKARNLPSGGDVIVTAGSVWATAADDNALVQLKAPGP